MDDGQQLLNVVGQDSIEQALVTLLQGCEVGVLVQVVAQGADVDEGALGLQGRRQLSTQKYCISFCR